MRITKLKIHQTTKKQQNRKRKGRIMPKQHKETIYPLQNTSPVTSETP
jgi:hypothetical protein